MASEVGGAASLGVQALQAHAERELLQSRKVWLHAWHDPLASLHAFSSCVQLADLNGDGDAKLLVAGMDRRLRVFKGTALLSENVLLDEPVRAATSRDGARAGRPSTRCPTRSRVPQVGIAVFYPEARKGATPSVAIASGQFVFIYRNLRPFYKFSLPELPVDKAELTAWAEVANDPSAVGALRERLSEAREAGVHLTNVSQELLAIDDPGVAEAFVQEHTGAPITRRYAPSPQAPCGPRTER